MLHKLLLVCRKEVVNVMDCSLCRVKIMTPRAVMDGGATTLCGHSLVAAAAALASLTLLFALRGL